jgi:hypothetical protein
MLRFLALPPPSLAENRFLEFAERKYQNGRLLARVEAIEKLCLENAELCTELTHTRPNTQSRVHTTAAASYTIGSLSLSLSRSKARARARASERRVSGVGRGWCEYVGAERRCQATGR